MFTFLSTIFFLNLQQERSFHKLCKISKAFLLIPRSLVGFWKRMSLTMAGAVLCMYVPAGKTKQNSWRNAHSDRSYFSFDRYKQKLI